MNRISFSDSFGLLHDETISYTLDSSCSTSGRSITFASPRSKRFATCYASGLRIGEACRLQVTDIDSNHHVIRVRDGKGGRERVTLLSPRLLAELRRYWLLGVGPTA